MRPRPGRGLARQALGCAAADRACGRPAAAKGNRGAGRRRGRARARAGGAETRAAFKRQADADADTFLRLRAAEFAPGGLLFIVVPSRMGERSCTPAMYDPVAHAAAELARAGDIDASLLEDLVMPSYIYEVEARARRRQLSGVAAMCTAELSVHMQGVSAPPAPDAAPTRAVSVLQ